MECGSMNLAAIKVSQRDVINTKNSNKGARWHLMGLHYVQGSVLCALWLFANNRCSRPALKGRYPPTEMKILKAKSRENLVRGSGRI